MSACPPSEPGERREIPVVEPIRDLSDPVVRRERGRGSAILLRSRDSHEQIALLDAVLHDPIPSPARPARASHRPEPLALAEMLHRQPEGARAARDTSPRRTDS